MQTKRPEFRKYAPPTEPHENRFVPVNLGTLASTKNARTRSIEFCKYIPRKKNIFGKVNVHENLTTEEDKALK